MKPSQNFFDLVEAFEGLKLTAYKDIAGIWTIGFGTITYPNGEKVKEGDTCLPQEAQDYLIRHIAGAQIPPMTQPQYDACLDFIYNVGQGAFNSSSLKLAINAQSDNETITADFLKWDKAHVNGELVEVAGLKRRRMCEAYLFCNGINHPTFFEKK